MLWLVALTACLAAVVYALAAVDLPAPWIIPDELIYSELAKSLGDGSLPSIRGEVTLDYGLVYPLLIAPAWAVFDDPAHAYLMAKIIGATAMSLAVFPAFFLFRRFVSDRSALFASAFSVLIPSMLLSGTLLIEPFLYPIFLVALLGMAAALQDPTRRNQFFALAAIGFACLTKPISVVLVPAYVMAVLHLSLLDRRRGIPARRRLRAHSTGLGLCAAAGAVVILGSAALGDAGAILGVYGVVLGNVDLSGTLVWLMRHIAGLDLFVAVVPFTATVTLVVLSLLGKADERIDEFAALALWTVAGTLVVVAAYASKPLAGAEGYLPSDARLHERNMFVLVPLLLLGLALFLERRKPGPRKLLLAVVAVCALLPVLLPLGRVLVNANFQALSVIPWSAGGIDRFWPFTFLPVAALAVWVLLSPPERSVVRAWALVGAVFVVTTIAAHASMAQSKGGAADTTGVGYDRAWIDRAVGRTGSVLALWVAPGPQAEIGRAYRTIWMSEFFNRSVGKVVEVGDPMPYDLAHEEGSIAGGVLRDDDGAPIAARYVLAPCWVTVDGSVVAGDPRVEALVYRVRGATIDVSRTRASGGGCGGGVGS